MNLAILEKITKNPNLSCSKSIVSGPENVSPRDYALYVIMLKILDKVRLTGQDRPSEWIFPDPWATANVSICLQKIKSGHFEQFLDPKKITQLPPPRCIANQ